LCNPSYITEYKMDKQDRLKIFREVLLMKIGRKEDQLAMLKRQLNNKRTIMHRNQTKRTKRNKRVVLDELMHYMNTRTRYAWI